MSNYDNTNRAALFKNDKKQSDNHPDYKGSANVEGVEYWLSAWVKTPQNGGAKFMSLSLTPKEQSAPQHQAQKQDVAQSYPDDEIPF